MSRDTELQSFLPKSGLDLDSATVTGSSPSISSRTRVIFFTKKKDLIFFNCFAQEGAVFAFPPNSTVQQAAEYAVARYPQSKSHPPPLFHNVWIFFSKSTSLDSTIAITDLGESVHSMFKDNDYMVVTNDPDVISVYQEQLKRIVLLFIVAVATFTVSILYFTTFRQG
ncbi:CIC11C00000002168 [Sungouiella intermedia]|uniref:CIC11C00000002168 n=1 Tax=Sungouiella intermedia TaxID=45354 RepID=A0A1L0GM92_9ASCO|nr:CIC11C00000002168 [[Candida] intermedia]